MVCHRSGRRLASLVGCWTRDAPCMSFSSVCDYDIVQRDGVELATQQRLAATFIAYVRCIVGCILGPVALCFFYKFLYRGACMGKPENKGRWQGFCRSYFAG